MYLNPTENNAFESIKTLVKEVNIRVTSTSLKKALISHYDFPSLSSICDVLEDFNVPNLATKLNSEQLQQIPLPALVYINIDGGTFATIKKISENQIEWQHNTLGTKNESIEDFSEKWDGVALLIEPNENSGEIDYEKSNRKEFIESLRIPFVLIGLLTCLLFLIYPIIVDYTLDENLLFYGLLLTKSLGVTFSTLLVWYSLDASNSFLNKICQLNKKTNCQNILSSEAASIGGIISWSEVGLIYFLGGLLSLLFFEKNTVSLLQNLSLLALPYTFWSIYHQAFVAKIWCPLCLCVQALLWVEFIISLPVSVQPLPINTFLELGICTLFVAATIALVKKPLTKSLQTESLTIELQKLKFNPDFVQSFLSKESFLPPFDHKMQMIELGNPEAEAVFQIVVNPVCGACRQKFLDIMKIVEHKDEVRFQVILSSSKNQEEISNQVTKLILGLHHNSSMIEALYQWFLEENQDFNVWKRSIKTTVDDVKGESQRLLHRQWLDVTNITHVPITFLNHVEIPTIYSTKEAVKLLRYYSNVGFRNQ